MSQPQYSQDAVKAMTNEELSAELRDWAKAREYVSKRRGEEGKEPLDSRLLREAAERLLIKTTVYVPVSFWQSIKRLWFRFWDGAPVSFEI